MSCGCNNYPFPPQSCDNGYQTPATRPVCRPHFPALRKNFITPAPNTPIIIELTDTQDLYVGQGIKIGAGFYIISDIVDSLRVEVISDGTVAEGLSMVAYDVVYGCAQHPVVPAGLVTVEKAVTAIGLEADRETVVAAALSNITKNTISYGYIGPKHIQFRVEVIANTVDTPAWIGIELPTYLSDRDPAHTFVAQYNEGAGLLPAVGTFGNAAYFDYLLIGKGGGSTFVDGTNRVFRAAGVFEVL